MNVHDFAAYYEKKKRAKDKEEYKGPMAVLYFGGMTGGKWGTEPLRVDISLPISLISKKTIDNMGVRYEEVPSPNSFQTGGITYTPVGHLKLQWKQQGWESNLHDPEAFFVVDVSDPGIVLGNSADPYGKGLIQEPKQAGQI